MKDRISVAGESLKYLAISAVFTIVISITASVSDAQTLKPVYQVNCGGPAVGTFSADTYFQGGTPYGLNATVDSSPVSNAPPPQVYNSQRYGNFTYSFPNLTPNTQYVVRLHFAETYFADSRQGRYNTAQAGQRVFNVSINRRVALDHFDILASSKFNQGVVKEFAITADDFGKIEIIFQNVVTNAFVNAIEILQGTSSSAGQLSAAPVLAASQVPVTAAALQAEDTRIERLAEIAARLQDEKTDPVPLVTEAAGLMGFSIQTEEHVRVAPPKAAPALHLAVTDSEIRGYSELFRRHHSVALADLINAMDYTYKAVGSKTS
ncbi:MAG TPA: malectin domain-containing carbohydrate-binding protein, partial [Pyrinomonadaceae bacterium]|nr:malectin domain-containing carbohydrate-binding protein [Pyrinomonadaceae bacterium]